MRVGTAGTNAWFGF